MALARYRAAGADRRLGALVYRYEAQEALGYLARPGGALDLPVYVRLERVPPDRAPDREADEAVDGSGLDQPVFDLGVVGAAPEDHAADPVTPPGASLRDEHLAVRALIDALDLPDVDLDARILDLRDRPAHQLGAQLAVVALILAADASQLDVLGGHEQLEEELSPVLLQPVAQPPELGELLAICRTIAVGVVADEHLGEVGVEAFDVLAEVIAVLEVEHLLARALGGIASFRPCSRASAAPSSRTAGQRARP